MAPAKTSAYGLLALAYILGCGSLGWFVLFLWAGPRPFIDFNLSTLQALSLDALLSLAFFFQHSGMIRRSCRARLGVLISDEFYPVVYAITSGIALLLIPLLWQPTSEVLFTLGVPWRWLPRAVFLGAMAGIVWSFASLKFFDPLGAQPLLARLRGTPLAASPLTIHGTYRWVRHPIYALFLVMMWAVPDVRADRLLFNAVWTIWMVVGTRLEERDLTAQFGDGYRDYQRRVPMLVPRSLYPRG